MRSGVKVSEEAEKFGIHCVLYTECHKKGCAMGFFVWLRAIPHTDRDVHVQMYVPTFLL
ncbi:MAG: hypothetical protein RLY87_1159 [Chloroflexota bacterium]|jgi:hypothetical protein